jgi:hypothetical protein
VILSHQVKSYFNYVGVVLSISLSFLNPNWRYSADLPRRYPILGKLPQGNVYDSSSLQSRLWPLAFSRVQSCLS